MIDAEGWYTFKVCIVFTRIEATSGYHQGAMIDAQGRYNFNACIADVLRRHQGTISYAGGWYKFNACIVF
jgi:hypothetical protein